MTDHPAVELLCDTMSGISEDVYAAGWLQDCEWALWHALTEWRAGRPAVGAHANLSPYMTKLDWLHRQAGGWWMGWAKEVER